MVDSIRFFEEAARVGEAILSALDSGPANQKLASYFERSGKIYKLMANVHDEVSNITIRVSLTRDLGEAKHALGRLDNERLADVFRARDWCDEFEWLGKELLPLGDELNLSKEDRDIWYEFCSSLRQREGEVAYLYEDKLYELRRLRDSKRTLPSLKKEVDRIAKKLVTQKASFDFLAKKAEAMRRRMR